MDEAALFEAFSRMMTVGEALPVGLVVGRGAPWAYRRGLLAACTEVIEDHYPVSCRLLGPDCVGALVLDYVQRYPPARDLDAYGEDWPPFLVEHPALTSQHPAVAAFAVLDFFRFHPSAPDVLEVVAPAHLLAHHDAVLQTGELPSMPLGPPEHQRWVREVA